MASFAACVLVIAVGCHRSSTHSHGDDEQGHAHDDGDEEKSTQFTVWTDTHEIFAEHELAVAGEPVEFVTHITDLRTLEPRRAGPVTFLLRHPSAPPIEQQETGPARAGIYLPKITLPAAGAWQLHIIIPAGNANVTIACPDVKVFASAKEAREADVPEAPEGISFLKEQQWKIQTKAEPAQKRTLTERVRVPATVQARAGMHAAISAPLSGRFVPVGNGPPPVGTRVEEGQTLATIQPSFSEIGVRVVEAEAEAKRTRLGRDQAELVFKRIESLAKVEARTPRELQEAEFALKDAQAKHEAALAVQSVYRHLGATFGLAGNETAGLPVIELKSPISGILVSWFGGAIGQYVTADESLFSVLDASRVAIEARVPELEIGRISGARDALFELPTQRGHFTSILTNGGRLLFSGIQVDPATRTVPIVFEVANSNSALRVGQALDLHVETARAENALAVPDSALVDENGQLVVFVQIAGETFERRPVTLGLRDGNWVEIVNGITEGERVVTKAAYAVRLASVSSALPAHGHAH